MKFYTAHLRTDRPPVLVREGFSWAALLFGPLWLAIHDAWLAAILVVVAEAAMALLVPQPIVAVPLLCAIWLVGLFGQDLRRWSLLHRGYTMAHVIAARDETAAFGRLLAVRPDLIGAGL